MSNKLCGNTNHRQHNDRIEELVDKVKELHNNNLARVEEELFHFDKVEVPINADKIEIKVPVAGMIMLLIMILKLVKKTLPTLLMLKMISVARKRKNGVFKNIFGGIH